MSNITSVCLSGSVIAMKTVTGSAFVGVAKMNVQEIYSLQRIWLVQRHRQKAHTHTHTHIHAHRDRKHTCRLTVNSNTPRSLI